MYLGILISVMSHFSEKGKFLTTEARDIGSDFEVDSAGFQRDIWLARRSKL